MTENNQVEQEKTKRLGILASFWTTVLDKIQAVGQTFLALGENPLKTLVAVLAMFLIGTLGIRFYDEYLGVQYKHRTGTVIEDVREIAAVDAQVQDKLARLLREVGADRAYLVQFHNGTYSVTGVPFLRMTATNEAVLPGVSREAENQTNLPISFASPFIKTLAAGECALVNRQQASPVTRDLMERSNTVIRVFCPVTVDSHLGGYLAVDYTKEFNGEKEAFTINRLLYHAYVISDLLEIKRRLGGLVGEG